ncbi:MAG: pyridoxamine 5-phosphate oxidase [Paracoccus sp. (in: a-proteobacteria)]|nr:pyridoxamine 5-phosphate oxidase [Paracoccus sp. (in: a-proteobacteria)]
MNIDPIRQTSPQARDQARQLINDMRHAVMAVSDAATGHPHLSRIACQPDSDGMPLAFLSAIAVHSRLLEADPLAGLLIEDTGARGDAMARPRLSLRVTAIRLDRDDPGHGARVARWVQHNPKARVYATLPDFHFWRLQITGGLLNAGFGQAFRLTPADLDESGRPQV